MTAAVVQNSPTAVMAPTNSSVDPSAVAPQNIKVAIRIRPLPEAESPNKSDEDETNGKRKKKKIEERRAWNLQRGGATNTLSQNGAVRKVEGRTTFHFDQIFDEDTLTPLLHQRITRPMVKSVLSGQHGTIFAYGQTGSGKTFTMQGDGKKSGGQAGIIQLVASDLFRFMRQGAESKREFTVKVSYVEIYNEKIRDLLSAEGCGSTMSHGDEGSPDSGPTANGGPVAEVTIRSTSSGQVVLNCQQSEVSSVDEVLDLLVSGNANRVVAKTDVNNHSSRSHAIFRLTIESREIGGQPSNGSNDVVRMSDFNLVDLAGSESVKMAGTSGIRQREGGKINQSLLSLSTVIHSLSLPLNKRPRHINYRDSKITRILQPHLQGNAEMAILCCISPSKASMEETRSTLKFAARAKLVEMTPKVNEVLDDSTKIKKLRAELDDARREIEALKKSLSEAQAAKQQYVQPNQQQRSSSRSPVPPRKYVMPTNQPLPQDQGLGGNDLAREYLKSHLDGSPDGNSADFNLDPTESGQKALFRYDTDDSDHFRSVDSAQEISGISEVHSSFDYPGPGKQLLQPTSFDYPYPDKAHTARTEVESTDGPEATYGSVSLKLGSLVSSPESMGIGSMPSSPRHDTLESGVDLVFSGRDNNTISLDSMDLNTLRPGRTGRPLQAMRSLTAREGPIPTEVTIIAAPIVDGQNIGCITDQIDEAEARAEFFALKLEDADDLIEALFKDLERARLCIHDLVFRNVKLAAKLKEKRREDMKEEYQEGEVVMEQYWLLKGAMYVSLFFFVVGGYEYFMATVILIWLILEANLTSPPVE